MALFMAIKRLLVIENKCGLYNHQRDLGISNWKDNLNPNTTIQWELAIETERTYECVDNAVNIVVGYSIKGVLVIETRRLYKCIDIAVCITIEEMLAIETEKTI